MDRRYIKYKITELEVLFSENTDNIPFLEELEEELNYRATQRARKLLHAVQNTLNNQAKSASSTHPKEHNTEKDNITHDTENINNTPIDWKAEFEELNKVSFNSKKEKVSQKSLNQPKDILSTWISFEALSPQVYKNPKDLVIEQGSFAYFTQHTEPWRAGEKSRKNHKLYYLVYLGAIDMGKAVPNLLQVYPQEQFESTVPKGFAALGVIVLNKKGIPVPDTGLALSSFGWSYARALEGNLDILQHWELAEKKIINKITQYIYHEDAQGNPLPLSYEQIQLIYQYLIKYCGLDFKDTIKPSFVTRLYQRFNDGEPEPPLINSFYLQDLQKTNNALHNKTLGDAATLYLGIKKPESFCNVLEDKSHIQAALIPSLTPPARWPNNGRHSLVLLQQAAVNLAKEQLKESGLFSINGPPGTGKTTLLRDVMASVLTERAKSLTKFKNADTAFTHAGQIKLGQGFIHLYKLDASLRGHEILVCSSNNKAVENITRELPLKTQFAQDIGDFHYFKTISDALSGQNNITWGLCAAVLGNKAKRNAFTYKTWWDDHSGLYQYLRFISGTHEPLFDKDENEIPRKIIEECDPPKSLNEAHMTFPLD